MFSAYSQISLSLNRKEMNHKLNFYIASGSSQTLTKFPGVQELIKGSAPHTYGLGEEQRNEAKEGRPVTSQEAAPCPLFAFGNREAGEVLYGSICIRKLGGQRENCHLSCNSYQCNHSTIKTKNPNHHQPFTLTDGNQPLTLRGHHLHFRQGPCHVSLQHAGRGAGTFPWLRGEGDGCRHNTVSQIASDLGGHAKDQPSTDVCQRRCLTTPGMPS